MKKMQGKQHWNLLENISSVVPLSHDTNKRKFSVFLELYCEFSSFLSIDFYTVKNNATSVTPVYWIIQLL